ncbi:MAG TPA: hypothetical protein VMD75_03335 [Candidatus Binataceae bacterium]|nr:hypothetical protein [Candidatus Binataceae bacterium]
MKSILRRLRSMVAAGAVVMLALGSVPALVSYALALNAAIPYVDKDQNFDQPPNAWLLMAPPTTTSGLTVDSQAGLAQWITYGRYSTLQDCSATIQMVRNGVIPNSGLPAQMSTGAISFASVPGGTAQFGYGPMQPGYPGAQPGGYPSMPPGYAGAPGYPPSQANPAMGQSGYAGMQPGYQGAPPSYQGMRPGYQGMQSGYQGAPPGYQGMQPGYSGMQSGYQGMQPGYQGSPGYGAMQPGAQGVPPGYASNQPIIQQPAQLMTRQQADEAYCFADNDRRLQSLIAPPPAVTPGQPGQSIPGVGQ